MHGLAELMSASSSPRAGLASRRSRLASRLARTDGSPASAGVRSPLSLRVSVEYYTRLSPSAIRVEQEADQRLRASLRGRS
jgi:hypothetical protein